MTAFVPVPNYDVAQLKGSTLILPTVSIGNVPQLVSDLIIHTFQFERVGFLDDDSLIPVSGIREDIAQLGVTVPIEVFQSKDRQFTCIQQRSPTLKGKRSQYIAMLTDFSQHFDRTVIVTSMDAARRLDSQINSPVPFRTLGIHLDGVATLELEEQEDKIPGSGLAMHLYKALKAPSLAVMFALEGDNVQDSIEYANFLNTLLKIKLDGSSWTPPKSWEYLFGTPYNAELYQ